MAVESKFTPDQIAAVNHELEGQPAEEIILWAYATFGKDIAFASSFGAEDVVLIDMIAKVAPELRVFTLDTGRLHDETYLVMEDVRERYGTDIETLFPKREKVERLVREKGFYSFQQSIENRKECCYIRKVAPLQGYLSQLQGWMTGLRREQAVTRADTPAVEIDAGNGGLVKVNPLVMWTNDEVWAYIGANKVPYNGLHDQGFPSIGCAPCTRAISEGEDIRAGRWWWELPEYKECGLHPSRAPQS